MYVPFAKLFACDEAALDDADAEVEDAVLDVAADVVLAVAAADEALDAAAEEAALDDAALELAPDEQPASTTVKVTSIAIAIALKYLFIPAPPLSLADRHHTIGTLVCKRTISWETTASTLHRRTKMIRRRTRCRGSQQSVFSDKLGYLAAAYRLTVMSLARDSHPVPQRDRPERTRHLSAHIHMRNDYILRVSQKIAMIMRYIAKSTHLCAKRLTFGSTIPLLEVYNFYRVFRCL